MPANAVLDVFAGAHPAGSLARSDVEEDGFLFGYGAGSRPPDAISLLMPVVKDPYVSTGGLLPIFAMNLPEGALLERLRLQFAKTVPNLDDLELLGILGQSQIGRLRYARAGTEPAAVPGKNIREILTYRGSEDLFRALVGQYAVYSGISGIQPKILLRADDVPLPRATHRGATHIVKTFNPQEYPELAANEFFCMTAARHAGIPTPHLELSENRKILVIERFDLLPDGRYLGVEDFCVLVGLRSHGRYASSYEKVAQRIGEFVSPDALPAAQSQFFSMLALSCAIENGDAHLKNFAVVYEHAESQVTLAPAYDLVATTPYVPRDVLALTLEGTKEFPSRKTLLRFAVRHCGLRQAKAVQLLERVEQGIAKAVTEMRRHVRQHPDFAQAGKHFIQVFERGRARSLAE